MQRAPTVRRFPVKAYAKKLGELADTSLSYRDYWRNAARVTDSPVLRSRLQERAQMADDIYHSMDAALRTLWFYR